MAEIFDKKTCLDNIYYLAKQKNIKIGELESKAGVSAGYLSRINKDDNTTNPGIEVLVSIANELEVPLEILIRSNLSTLTGTDEYILRFLKKLLKDTDSDTLIWDKMLSNDLYSFIKGTLDAGYYSSNPLFAAGIDPDFPEDGPWLVYNPIDDESFNVSKIKDFFYTKLSGLDTLYLVVIEPTDDHAYCELRLVSDGKAEEICSTKQSPLSVSEIIRGLYKSINFSRSRLHIKQAVKSVIDAYLTDKPKSI